jgi:hypothetical protein
VVALTRSAGASKTPLARSVLIRAAVAPLARPVAALWASEPEPDMVMVCEKTGVGVFYGDVCCGGWVGEGARIFVGGIVHKHKMGRESETSSPSSLLPRRGSSNT